MRRIATSHLYQLSDAPTASNARDDRHFARALRRRLPAEVLADMIADITAVPHAFDGMAPGTRAVQVWNVKLRSDILDAFGRPDSSEDPPCERDRGTTLVQSLHLMHAEDIQRRLHHDAGWVASIAKEEADNAAAVERVYLRCLCRPPSEAERAAAIKRLEMPESDRREALEDVLWALFNGAEFLHNH